MNTINLPEDKYKQFCFLVNEITKLRESIPQKTNNTKDYKNNPEKCCKILTIITFIQNNITKNKSFLKKKIGTVFEYYNIWINNTDIQLQLTKLNNENYLKKLLDLHHLASKSPMTSNTKIENIESCTTSTTKPSIMPEKRKFYSNVIDLDQICEKYITDKNIKTEVLTSLRSYVNGEVINHDDFLLKIGHLFPRYIISQIFGKYFSNFELKKKLEELKIPKYWSKEKMHNHGKELGAAKTKHKYKASELSLAIKKFKDSNPIEPYNISVEKIINEIENEKVNKPLNINQIVKYFWFLQGRLTVTKIMSLLNITIHNFYRLKSLFERNIELEHSKNIRKVYSSGFENFKEKIESYENKIKLKHNEQINIVNEDLIPSTLNTPLILPNGDIQVIFKYGTPEHKKYLCILNEKNN